MLFSILLVIPALLFSVCGVAVFRDKKMYPEVRLCVGTSMIVVSLIVAYIALFI